MLFRLFVVMDAEEIKQQAQNQPSNFPDLYLYINLNL